MVLFSRRRKYYTIKYSFSGDGYTSSKGSTKVLLIKNNQSTIKGSNYVAYKGFENVYTVTLTADGVKLANKKVRFNINGKNYYNTTNSKGKATLKINLPVGKYNIKYYFAGEKNIKSSSAKSTVTFKKGMPTKITRANSVKYYHKTEAPFKVKVLDARGNPVKGKVVFSIIRDDDLPACALGGIAVYGSSHVNAVDIKVVVKLADQWHVVVAEHYFGSQPVKTPKKDG